MLFLKVIVPVLLLYQKTYNGDVPMPHIDDPSANIGFNGVGSGAVSSMTMTAQTSHEGVMGGRIFEHSRYRSAPPSWVYVICERSPLSLPLSSAHVLAIFLTKSSASCV